ncbi:MAG: prolyl oligopeptidase family serine peptidase, partial [Sciscionella sp.]
MVKIASYGNWQSPITAAQVAAAGGSPRWVGQHRNQVWWAQPKPTEGGRLSLMCAAGGVVREVLSAPWNARNRVHEYGGVPWVLLATPDGDRVAFTHWDDQRIYLFDPDEDGAVPEPLTPQPATVHGWRYSELTAGPGGREVWCVRESVTGEHPTDIHRDLVAVPIDGGEARVLAASHHFMTAPKSSPDGHRLAWLGWDHPAMPWDGTQLCVAELVNGVAEGHRVVAGGPREAVCQFEWDGADTLLALTDPDGWWNLHRIGLDGTAVNLAPCTEELGGPMWQLGTRWFAPLGDGRHAVIRSGTLAVLDERTGTVSDVDLPRPLWSSLTASNGVVAGVAGSASAEPAVVAWQPDGELRVLSEVAPPPTDYLPRPRQRTFTDGAGRPVPAYVYPPRNPDFTAPEGELPPYLVHVHGGPTGRTHGGLNLDFAYFTSRGIGVVAVNYGGSVGYGRAFRERLREEWGVVDVADCATVAETLGAEGVADRDRLAVRGGSAGGWTSAASLTTVSTYRCGTVMYPILDLAGWTGEGGETHDFESQYIYGLVGDPVRQADRYRDRSPAHHADKLAGPVLLLQGLDDHICPPVQADRFIAQLDGSGIPHAYLTFDGEQHGFRRAETIEAALQAELSFYGQVLGFQPPNTT